MHALEALRSPWDPPSGRPARLRFERSIRDPSRLTTPSDTSLFPTGQPPRTSVGPADEESHERFADLDCPSKKTRGSP